MAADAIHEQHLFVSHHFFSEMNPPFNIEHFLQIINNSVK